MSCLKEIVRVQGPDWSQTVDLLQSLASVKSCLLLPYVDMELTVELFKQFFASVKSEHFSHGVAEMMLQIMVDLVCEMDELPEEVLRLIFARLLQSEENSAAYQVAKHLVSRCAAKLDAPVREFLLEVLGADHNSDTSSDTVTARPFDLVYEIFTIAPDMLLHIIPVLERDLTAEVNATRQSVVEVMCKMVAHPTSKLLEQSGHTFLALKERFKVREKKHHVSHFPLSSN